MQADVDVVNLTNVAVDADVATMVVHQLSGLSYYFAAVVDAVMDLADSAADVVTDAVTDVAETLAYGSLSYYSAVVDAVMDLAVVAANYN